MQVIFVFHGDPEDYVRTDAHLRVTRPEICPNCIKCGDLLALGYYSRWVSSKSRQRTTRVKIRRFRCDVCRGSTSMLPDFAQPYRLVATDTVDEYLSGSRSSEAVHVWLSLLNGYQRKFEDHISETRQALVASYGICELSKSAVILWGELCLHFGGARVLTARLAREVGMTVFGNYQCHKPDGAKPLHTSVLFSHERSPPIVITRP